MNVSLQCTYIISTVLILIERMEKKIISILKNARFSGKGRQSFHVMRILRMLISYVKLDHALYSINYGNYQININQNTIIQIGGVIQELTVLKFGRFGMRHSLTT